LLSNEFSLSEYSKIAVGWGFDPDHTGELTALPRLPNMVSMGPLRGRREMEGRGGEGRTRGREEGRRYWESWGIVPWLLGG